MHAVRSDGLWFSYSGQGPGIAHSEHDKSDCCARRRFEDGEGFGPNTSTSAACGLAADAVALLRALQRDTAKQSFGPKGWQERTGHGVINRGKAASALP